MAARDVNQVFAQAEAAFRGGRPAEARALLAEAQRLAGPHWAILHLVGLVEKRLGANDRALEALTAAQRLAPNDAQIANNLGNLLDTMGRPAEALAAYDKAVRAAPGLIDARLNRAITLHATGRIDAAREDFLAVLTANPMLATGWSGWGALERDAGDLHSAAMGFDRAIALDPSLTGALHGRARVALERGEADAVARYRQCLTRAPDDHEVILGLAQALDAEGDREGIGMLAQAVAERPEWIEGHEMLARLRAEAGAGAGFARSYGNALLVRPDDRDLHHSHLRTLARSDRHAEALAAIDRARGSIGEDRTSLLMEAAIAGEAGDLPRADAILARLDDGADVLLTRGRLLLRRGDPQGAAAVLERVVAADAGSIAAWAHLSLAWRLTGDGRHEWLCGQPGLYGTADVGLSAAELDALAALLRSIHSAKRQPIGQSIRGGTQTRGRLLARTEPEIARLGEALRTAVDAHVAALPPFDPTHPLLRRRERPFTFDGSWSVRLQGSGFHINHIHPDGVLSSACYIAVPEGDGGTDKAGWLTLGAPPAELGLTLEPLALIEPRPGRLALFPSYLFHGTLPFAAGERLTVAFDVLAR